jgi:3-mercaptopyruvate sulfurtransferase SseA
MNLITRDELRRKLDANEDVTLVMTHSMFAYTTKHIPGSLHFETVADALATLDRSAEIVVYCADVHCAASVYAYRLLEREGFVHLRRFAGGVAEWEDAGYPLESGAPAEAAPSSARPRSRPLARPWYVCA